MVRSLIVSAALGAVLLGARDARAQDGPQGAARIAGGGGLIAAHVTLGALGAVVLVAAPQSGPLPGLAVECVSVTSLVAGIVEIVVGSRELRRSPVALTPTGFVVAF